MDDLNSIFIRQINEKQEKAFHELFLRFFNYLVVYAMRRVQRRDVAEDIVQEVFVNVWEGNKEFTRMSVSGLFFIMLWRIDAWII